MQVAVEFQNEIIFTSFKAPEILFYRHVESLWLSLIPTLKMVEERWYQQKLFYEVFNLEKGFQKDQSAKSKISDNCTFF